MDANEKAKIICVHLRPFAAILFCALAACAQTPEDDLEWSVALGGRFRQMQEPVVAAYALAELGGNVCRVDRIAAAGLFRDSLNRINTLPDNAFREARQRLPVSSLSRLYRVVTGAAFQCDPGLAQFVTTASIHNRLMAERQEAPARLVEAQERLEDDPDRAEQLADSAMAASDPGELDVAKVARFLSKLRERAPDLADELFPAALDFVTSAPAPDGAALARLGSYLFTAPRLLEYPDKEMREALQTIGSYSIPDLTVTRHDANSEDIPLYLDALLRMLKSTAAGHYDPLAVYAVAYQMLPHARDIGEDTAKRLQDAIEPLLAAVGGEASTVQAAFAGGAPPDVNGGEAGAQHSAAIRRVLERISSQHFAEARHMLPDIDDAASKGQISTWIEFAEAAAALQHHELMRASSLANALSGGVKRALLYAGLTAARQGEPALEEVALAVKDTESLPAEQRVAMLSAAGAAAVRVDGEMGQAVLNQVVTAANDAARSPRRGRFNPRMVRERFNPKGPISGDSALIAMSSRGVYEVADTGQRRFNFPLRVSGVEALDLPGFVRNAGKLEFRRVEAALLSLDSENARAAALNALAAARLKQGR